MTEIRLFFVIAVVVVGVVAPNAAYAVLGGSALWVLARGINQWLNKK
jgi:hypothetical protein